jgi:hypothetical protein
MLCGRTGPGAIVAMALGTFPGVELLAGFQILWGTRAA